ncbi:MAG: hypothetical protein RQ756_06635 [Flavobacteriaceae bacterium]|nr:hypothetical protein [Flavobacteriaceae bacterium]
MRKELLIAISMFFSLCITYNAVRSGFMLTYYLVDTDNFIELYCVNKNKPELQCNGKCALALEQTEDETQPINTENRILEILLIPMNLIHTEYHLSIKHLQIFEAKPSYANCKAALNSGYCYMVIPPPKPIA